MTEGIKIEIYRELSADELTKKLSTPDSKAGAGSAAAASAAIAASMLARAAQSVCQKNEANDKIEWFVRNTEILRDYMVKLIDEDVKCHGPLRRAVKEGDERRIEAARQSAVSICLEIINMMGKALEMTEKLLEWADSEEAAELAESADLAYGASLAAGRHVLYMSRLSPDDTYRYVMHRENELTMAEQQTRYAGILEKAAGEKDKR